MGRRTNTAVWLEKYQRWQINVQKDSIRRTFCSSTPGRAGLRECNGKADAWLDGGLVNTKTKLSALYESWIEELKITTCQDHWRKYDGFGRNWIYPAIGHISIGNITEQHLQNIITKAHKKGLAKKTLSNLRGCLVAFIKFARKNKASILAVEDLYIPNGAKVKEKTILQPSDLSILFREDNTILNGKETYELFIQAFRFEALTGLRPGEVFGLKTDDVFGGYLHIKRSINSYGDVTSGKNENAQRSFMLTPYAKEILRIQADKLKELKIRQLYTGLC